jgi:hypothetical protein
MATFLARGLGGVDVQQTFSIPRTQRKYSVACSAELLGSLSEFPDPRLDEGPNSRKIQGWHGSCSFTFVNLQELGGSHVEGKNRQHW